MSVMCTRERTELGSQTCRACLKDRMFEFLDLGVQPIANRYVLPGDRTGPEPAFPLRAYVCLDCALIQVPNRVPPEFFRHYLYVSSAAEGLRQHFDAFAEQLASGDYVPPTGYLVDIGCNDGLFLSACKRRGVRVLGVDPARNLAERVRADGIDVVNDYFSRDLALRIRSQDGPASVVTTSNTFNHIDDLQDFVEGVRELLDEDGVFVVEVPHAADLLENNEFDTIYHEHLSEFSLASFGELFAGCGLSVVDVEPLTVHGGSLRVWAKPVGGGHQERERVVEYLKAERIRGLFDPATYAAFRERVASLRERLRADVATVRNAGGKVAAYGAPAKGMTLLSYCGFGPDDIAFVADRSPLKQGRLTPGTHIPIVDPNLIASEHPDVLLVLAWNYIDEIRAQQREFVGRGGRFLVPIPMPHFVGGESSPEVQA